jgi:hypothetical protein
MQNADSNVSSPAPSGPGIKRKRSVSLQGGRGTKKMPPLEMPVQQAVMPSPGSTLNLFSPMAPSEEMQIDEIDMDEDESLPPPLGQVAHDLVVDGKTSLRIAGSNNVAGAAAIAAATKALSDSEEWQNTIERIVKSVVAIRFCQVCPCNGVH